MTTPFSESELVEQPAIGLCDELGWQTVSAMEEAFGPDGTLGRDTSGEMVLVRRLRAALEKLNPRTGLRSPRNGIPQLSARNFTGQSLFSKC